ncbi:MAG: DUF4124 domain-containing protein [Ectothiorhodospiraceae bacterium]|nr:DUF4124 domain-containing protein [Chromatiales bacterium]MCP5157327.1 DUF4124 domain-containing protein [Ectothiorhodospiraceae bacterium]
MNVLDRRASSLLALVAALALAPLEAGAAIKCWTNKDGVRECGNAIPPEYAQQGHVEKSTRGLTVRETARAKTNEELSREREEREREEREQAERDRLAQEQAQRDRVLLHTYTTEDDLVLARDGHLAALDSRMKHTRQVNLKLNESLDELRGEAAALERAGKPVPDKMRDDIANLRKQISANDDSLGLREQERTELITRFDRDLARYRELRKSGR